MAKEKPAVGFYDLTGCNGCLLSFVFNEDELLDMARHFEIKSFRFIKEVKEENGGREAKDKGQTTKREEREANSEGRRLNSERRTTGEVNDQAAITNDQEWTRQ